MPERTAPPVLLAGDWPPASPGYSHFPSAAPVVWHLAPAAFRVYGYLVSLGYSQEGLSPLPQHVGPGLGLSDREVKAAYSDLCGCGLLVLVGEDGAEPQELQLPAPAGIK